MKGFDKWLETNSQDEENAAYEWWCESMIDKLPNEFLKEKEDWIFNSILSEDWQSKLYGRDISMEKCTKIFERAIKIYAK